MAALSLRASDELSHLGHRAASKDLVEVGPQSALHKVSEDTDPVARVREPWKPFREDVEVREVQRLAMTNSCGESPAPPESRSYRDPEHDTDYSEQTSRLSAIGASLVPL